MCDSVNNIDLDNIIIVPCYLTYSKLLILIVSGVDQATIFSFMHQVVYFYFVNVLLVS